MKRKGMRRDGEGSAVKTRRGGRVVVEINAYLVVLVFLSTLIVLRRY